MTHRSDRGAVAVWVAILMVPFLILAALAIDVGAANADRQRLQHGADAAALAIAQECALGDCAGSDATAQELADNNSPMGGDPTATVLELDVENGWVEVQTESSRDFWFAPIIDRDSATMQATSAASWNQYPTGGAHLPLAISWCEIVHWAGLDAGDVLRNGAGEVIGLSIPEEATDVVLFSKGNKTDFHACPSGTNPNGSNGAAPPGGFGWLTTSAPCSATTAVDGSYYSEPGRSPTCDDAQLREMIGTTVLVPIFDSVVGSGRSGAYRVFGYIAFTLEGYSNNKGEAGVRPPSCKSNDDCIFGTIQRFVDLGSGFTTSPGGPQLGTTSVELRLPNGE
ncbi:pilus assembly protein TadG-related protein [Agrococcus sp. SCSIO52902]|uniref:TadE/TadG family type IV pilus assembly protein n=1 Tax=Agrococcus sp. SCSIO52902 TaxID=2933290 RepID=UPI001FF4FEC5|nr:pilus assembly protein TadG-related protein [Agrococcus sp. SCSIO52902]UOW00019.1 pilus assembly protein TadG-related protein [Agrococcus sp. SCSIO52902]